MRLLVSWLRDFVDVSASPEDIAHTLGLRGFEVAAIEPLDDDDAVIDFEVTANRPDALSVLGLAREVATAYDRPLRSFAARENDDPTSADRPAPPALAATPVGDTDLVTVALEDADLCPRYAVAVADVTIGASPAWMSRRLEAAGVRPISNIVDLTNYLLMEMGQPMHAFDLAKLAGPALRIRRAQKGETIRTLDDVERKLDPEMLVIADAHVAQAVAGVMGGGRSEVSASTRRVAFESAYFKPASVRRTSKRLGLKTEASSRFERGADVNAPVVALERLVALMEQIGAGRVIAPIVDRYPAPRHPRTIHLRRERLALLLGASVPDPDVERILRNLGLTVTRTPDGWDGVAPTFRVDLQREADLVEEVGRHYGFDRLEARFPALQSPAAPPDPRIARDRGLRHVATAAGLSEAVTFSFIEARAAEAVAGPAGLVRIANPLSAKFEVLRPSLVPGLLEAVAYNRRRGRADVRLFEIGARFSADGGETRAIGLAWTGAAGAEHWSQPLRKVDFFDVKGVVERICEELNVDVAFEPVEATHLVAGRAARVLAHGAGDPVAIGTLGLAAPALVDVADMPRQDEVYLAEIDLDAAWYVRRPRADAVAPLPRFPAVVRDLSILVADTLPASIIRGTIQAAGAKSAAPLVGVAVFDRYQGKGIPDGSVSVSVRLTFQAPDRTLTDAEIQQGFDTILAALAAGHGAVQR